MRLAIVLVPALLLAGCAYLPSDVSRVQMTARNGGAVYHGTIAVAREYPAISKITIEVERRTYRGNLELTNANETNGLYALYGARDAAAKTAQASGRTNYTKAILASSDKHILTCDFTDNSGKDMNGLCVDEAKRVYDVVLN